MKLFKSVDIDIRMECRVFNFRLPSVIFFGLFHHKMNGRRTQIIEKLVMLVKRRKTLVLNYANCINSIFMTDECILKAVILFFGLTFIILFFSVIGVFCSFYQL